MTKYMISYGERGPTIEEYWERTYEFYHSSEEEEEKYYGLTWEEARKEVADWYRAKANQIEEMEEEDYFVWEK